MHRTGTASFLYPILSQAFFSQHLSTVPVLPSIACAANYVRYVYDQCGHPHNNHIQIIKTANKPQPHCNYMLFFAQMKHFRPPTFSSSRPCCRQACLGTSLNELALKLSKGPENIENHLAGYRSGVDAAVIDRAKSYSSFLQLFDNINKIPQ